MKMHKLLMLMASTGLIFGMMTGCGGGSSDGGIVLIPEAPVPTLSPTPVPTPVPTLPPTGLDPEDVNGNLENIAAELGCDYTANAKAKSVELNIPLGLKTANLIKDIVVVNSRNAKEVGTPAIMAKVVDGSCGGNITIPDEGMIGTFTFNDYCIDSDELNGTINGSLSVASGESAGTIIISTPTPITIKSTNPSTGENVDVTLDMDEVVISQFADEHIEIDIKSLTVNDHVQGTGYSIENFHANMTDSLITFNGTFNNPVVTGTVQVIGSANIETKEMTMNATDENGDVVTLESTDVEGVFDASFNDELLGIMDCSMVSIPEI